MRGLVSQFTGYRLTWIVRHTMHDEVYNLLSKSPSTHRYDSERNVLYYFGQPQGIEVYLSSSHPVLTITAEI